jgi:hypothetical protein
LLGLFRGMHRFGRPKLSNDVSVPRRHGSPPHAERAGGAGEGGWFAVGDQERAVGAEELERLLVALGLGTAPKVSTAPLGRIAKHG